MDAMTASSGLVALQLTMMVAVVGFTNPKSTLRPAAIPLVALCPYLQLPLLDDISHPILRAFLGGACVYIVLLYTDTAVIHKWDFDGRGPTSDAGGLRPALPEKPKTNGRNNVAEPGMLTLFWRRLKFGLGTSLQTRFPATKWPVRNIPPFSKNDPGHVPLKVAFISGELLKLIACLLFLISLDHVPKDPETQRFFSSEYVALFSRLESITRSEGVMRSASVLGYWTSQYVVIQAVYSVFAILTVTLGVCSVASWPPVFGSLSDAYSIRNFWGVFYHQWLRRGFGSVAHLVVCTCLGFSKRHMLGRHLYTICVFAASGVFHTLCDITQGIPRRDSGALQFFIMQAFGIIFEDFLHALLHIPDSRDGSKRDARGTDPSWFLRTVGYIWTATWLIWSTPVWIFPTLERSNDVPLIPLPSDPGSVLAELLLQIRTNASSLTLISVLKGVCVLEGVVMVLSSFAAMFDPTSIAKNFGLPPHNPVIHNHRYTGSNRGVTTKELYEKSIWKASWVLFAIREFALGSTIIALACLNEVRALGLIELSLNFVALGDSYSVFRYGEKESTSKHFVPFVMMLGMGPALLVLADTSS